MNTTEITDYENEAHLLVDCIDTCIVGDFVGFDGVPPGFGIESAIKLLDDLRRTVDGWDAEESGTERSLELQFMQREVFIQRIKVLEALACHFTGYERHPWPKHGCLETSNRSVECVI